MRFVLDGEFRLSQTYKTSHDGWDVIGMPSNRYPKVYAPEDCYVEIASRSRHRSTWPIDNWCILRGKSGTYYYMGHFKDRSLRIKTGQRIKEGTWIATMGSTGKSSGPHCHLEVRTQRVIRGFDPMRHWQKHGVVLQFKHNGTWKTSTKPDAYKWTYRQKPKAVAKPVRKAVKPKSTPAPVAKVEEKVIKKQEAVKQVERKKAEPPKQKEKQVDKEETVLVNQPTSKPGNKVIAGGAGTAGGGGIVTMILMVIQDRTGVEFSTTETALVVTAVAALTGFIAAYYKRERKN